MRIDRFALSAVFALWFAADALAWGGMAADDPRVIVAGAAGAFALPALVAGLWVMGRAAGRSLGAVGSALACAAVAAALVSYLHPDLFAWFAGELSRRL